MMTRLSNLPGWQQLQTHYEQVKDLHMRELFADDPDRFKRFSLSLNDILFDFSKNRITEQTLELLLQLAHQADVSGWRDKMFAGEPINHTEQRAVQHVALRNRRNEPLYAGEQRIDQEIKSELARVKSLAESIRTRQWRGHSGQPITDVVNIGIGGSHLARIIHKNAALCQ